MFLKSPSNALRHNISAKIIIIIGFKHTVAFELYSDGLFGIRQVSPNSTIVIHICLCYHGFFQIVHTFHAWYRHAFSFTLKNVIFCTRLVLEKGLTLWYGLITRSNNLLLFLVCEIILQSAGL